MVSATSNFGRSFGIIHSNQYIVHVAFFSILIASYYPMGYSDSGISQNLAIPYEPDQVNQGNGLSLEVEKRSTQLEDVYDQSQSQGSFHGNYDNDDIEETKRQIYRYNFGLGKRYDIVPNRFAFGLGKRNSFQRFLEPDKMFTYEKEGKLRPTQYDQYLKKKYSFGVGKRGHKYYAFGLGK